MATPDREKVIKGLECCIVRKHPCGDCVYFVANPNDEDTGWCDRDKIIRNAIELLKAHEAINPYIDYDGQDVWRCGKCGNSLMHPSYYESDEDAKNHIRYCSHCGKAVKWE